MSKVVIIGMDPPKRSATVEVIDDRERVLDWGRFGTDQGGYQLMLAAGRGHPDRTWAVEGCNGIGRHIAQAWSPTGGWWWTCRRSCRRGRVCSPPVRDARPTQPTRLRSRLWRCEPPRLQVVRVDDALVALRLLVDRRDQLGRARSQTVNRRHRLLPELVPGAKRFLSATQARALVSPARPRDVAGRTRRRLASELISDLAAIDRKIRAANVQPRQLIAATGSGQLELNGLGPSGAARPLGDVGDICRFADRARFASWNGTAPIDASSGDQRRHRLSRAGNRRINRVPPIMAIVQLRNDTEGRAHDRRTLAAGKTTTEALRCPKRRLSDVVYRQMIADAKTAAGPGGQAGTTLQSSVTDPTPAAGSSEKSLPGPATNNPTPAAASKPVRSSARSRRRSSAPNRSPRQAHPA